MKVVVAGATGLIGGFLVDELMKDLTFQSIAALTRKNMPRSEKVDWIKANFDSQEHLKQITKDAEVVFCCLGTTMKTAGSKEAFRKVDYDYVVRLAMAASENRVRQFSVISALGANTKSKLFYNQVKGDMEEALRKIRFKERILFHPSFLIGPRKEIRIGEKIGVVIAKLLSPVMLGSLAKYRPIHVSKIAKAMIREAKIKADRNQILEYDEIITMS